MTQTLIEINGKLNFSQIWTSEISWNISFITITVILSFLKGYIVHLTIKYITIDPLTMQLITVQLS